MPDDLEGLFEKLVRDKAKKQTKETLQNQARALGISEDKLDAFKIGSWDAMIFDMAHALNLGKYATHDYRQKFIKQWLKDKLGD